MADKQTTIPAAAIARYEELIAEHEGFEMKGAKSRYTSLNGNMFSYLSGDGSLALRVSKEQREAFLSEHPKAISIEYGTVMKDYILVPKSIAAKPRELSELFAKCVAHARTLKAKPTTRKQAAKQGTAKKKVAKKKASSKKRATRKP